MIERKLSKTQIRVFQGLAQQRTELQSAFAEVVQAENEQIEMLRKQYDLPEGNYHLRQEATGDVVMYLAEPEIEEKGKPKKQ